jgi:hypothetical protein
MAAEEGNEGANIPTTATRTRFVSAAAANSIVRQKPFSIELDEVLSID